MKNTKNGFLKGLVWGGAVGGVAGSVFSVLLSHNLSNSLWLDILDNWSLILYYALLGAFYLGVTIGIISAILGLVIDIFSKKQK